MRGLSVLEMIDQAEKLSPPPMPQVVEELEELMAVSVARTDEELQQGLPPHRDDETVRTVEQLTRRFGILGSLPTHNRMTLCRRMNVWRLRSPNQPIFKQGEACRDFFITVHGCFEVIHVSEGNQDEGIQEFYCDHKVVPGRDFYYEQNVEG
eukprot:CAMPEP_0173421844 /NCGR_PEP_ID=MMETSP1357-20121228/2795_1 /TAXON_ID=77926 /ORGANISM="Hemiselmis rufescens, Strain PCC563" /LENGTH=151 /DNA_ID=CAMNT_0014384803 /DNA_START=78 /DNA_END=530 /DNA_ORIENTATION=+